MSQRRIARSNHKPPLGIIVGPTAVGKTELSIAVAGALGAEIVSADSMQVYRGLDIGTAKATPAERAEVPHHLIDVVDPSEPFSVAQYRDMAKEAIGDIHARGKLPLLVGGTGLYVRAVLDEFMLPDDPGPDMELRNDLTEYARERGNEALHHRLAGVDPETAERLHPNDVRRVIRALEVFMSTGEPMSAHLARASAKQPPYRVGMIGLTRPRDILYERIDRRVDMLLAAGLLEEVRALRSHGFRRDSVAGQALGYKEFFSYLDGECTVEEAAETLKRETRRYAKRQLTWFRRDERLKWFDLSKYANKGEVTQAIVAELRRRLYGPDEVTERGSRDHDAD